MAHTVHLVRHGEVENPMGVIYGRLPRFHLSERGRRQAEAVGARLGSANVGAVWASPLERARETAALIAQHHDLEVTTDDRLLESLNSFEGVGRTLWALVRNPRHWWWLRNPLTPSWGESFRDVRDRMLEAIASAREAAAGREVVIVSHQTPLIVARNALTRRRVPPWLGFTPCQTGSVTTLVLDAGEVLSAAYFAPPEPGLTGPSF